MRRLELNTEDDFHVKESLILTTTNHHPHRTVLVPAHWSSSGVHTHLPRSRCAGRPGTGVSVLAVLAVAAVWDTTRTTVACTRRSHGSDQSEKLFAMMRWLRCVHRHARQFILRYTRKYLCICTCHPRLDTPKPSRLTKNQKYMPLHITHTSDHNHPCTSPPPHHPHPQVCEGRTARARADIGGHTAHIAQLHHLGGEDYG